MSLELLGDSSHASLVAVGTWAQIVGAIGTLLAVIVALFGSQLRRFLVPPRLDIGAGDPEGVVVEGDGGERPSARWYHLRVSNPHRWSPITSAKVFLLEIERRDSSGKYGSVWKGAVSVQWRYADALEKAVDIGFPRACDLCVITSDHMLRLQPSFWRGLDVHYTAYSHPVRLRLTLQASGLEADSRCLKVQLKWCGKGPAARHPVFLREIPMTR
jgi:hypothetical protein